MTFRISRCALLFLALAASWLPGNTAAHAQAKVGTTAAQFLGIAVGPRAIAMGSAYVASGQDVTSIYWNPGGFVQSNRTEVTFVNTDWLAGTNFRWFGFMYSLDESDALGISLTQLSYGEEEVTTVAQPEGTGERWDAQDLAVGVSYARRLTDRFSIGGTAKFVNQSIWNESASNMTFDVGLLFVTDFNSLRIGMSMSNFGGDLTLEGSDLLNTVDIDPANPGGNKTLVGRRKTDAWSTPLLFRVGMAMDVAVDDMVKATVALDALRPSDNELTTNAGAEINWRDMVFLRGGYKSFFGEKRLFKRENQLEGLALGAGLRYAMEGVGSLQVDYSFSKFGVFGNINTFSVVIGF